MCFSCVGTRHRGRRTQRVPATSMLRRRPRGQTVLPSPPPAASRRSSRAREDPGSSSRPSGAGFGTALWPYPPSVACRAGGGCRCPAPSGEGGQPRVVLTPPCEPMLVQVAEYIPSPASWRAASRRSRSAMATGRSSSPPPTRAAGCCCRPGAAPWSRTGSPIWSPPPGSCPTAWSSMASASSGIRQPAGCPPKRSSAAPPPAAAPPPRSPGRPPRLSSPSTPCRSTTPNSRHCPTPSAADAWKSSSRPAP